MEYNYSNLKKMSFLAKPDICVSSVFISID